jgi:hypothetical protein
MHLAVRPSVTAAMGIRAIAFVHGEPIDDGQLISYAREHIRPQLAFYADAMHQLDISSLSAAETKFAAELARIRAEQANVLASIKAPDGGSEVLGFFMDHHAVDRSRMTQAEIEKMKMRILMDRLGNYAGDNLRMQTAFNTYTQLEKAFWDKITAFTQTTGNDEVQLVITEVMGQQSANSKAALDKLSTERLAQSLIGSNFGGEPLLEGEIRAVRIISQVTAGSCIMTEAEVDIVGAISKKPKTLRGRCAHWVDTRRTPHLLTSR